MIFPHCDSSCILITEILDHWENFHRPIASLGAFDPTKIGKTRVGRLAELENADELGISEG